MTSDKNEEEPTYKRKQKKRELCNDRVLNENVMGMLKRFKSISGRYQSRRKNFGLRFNFIATLNNMKLVA